MLNKRIAFCITKSCVGGAQKFVKEQLQILFNDGFKVYLITNEEGWLVSETKSFLSGSFLDKGIESVFSIIYCWKLRKFLSYHHIDLIVCNSANGGVWGRLAAYRTNTKSVFVSHGWSSVYNGGKASFIYNSIEHLLSRIGTSTLCISDKDYNIGLDVIKISGHKLHLLPNSIFALQGKAPLHESDTIVKILIVARLEHPKRVDLLLEAIKGLNDRVYLTVVGGGSCLTKLKQKSINENINNVIFKGEIANFDDFSDHSIFVLISESEGLPISALEAMSSGLALILSDVGGCGMMINKNGVLTKNDPTAILESLQQCIKNLPAYQSRSLELFDERFNLEKTAYKYLDYYRKLLGT